MADYIVRLSELIASAILRERWRIYLTLANVVPIYSVEIANKLSVIGNTYMAIQNLNENVILVTLPPEPRISEELKKINELISGKCEQDVIIDFTNVEIITSQNLSNLLILRSLLRDNGRQLMLCNVSMPTKCIFTVAGLDAAFEFADNRQAALAAMQYVP